jgi:2'-hydroxyisoflavone reductase
MNILVIGGTQFLGRSFVEQALAEGHDLTLFNRGLSNPELFKQVPTIIGDRKKDLEKLNEKMFDAVLDTSGYFPQNLKAVAGYFKSRTEQYVFISSCSVYDHNNQNVVSFDETAPLVNLNVDVNDESWETYGARKYLCEEQVRSAFPENHFIIRPGLIVGPHDTTYRFSYWGDRVAEGGEVLAPGDPKAPLQFIDVRDLGAWILHGMESKLAGTFNASSPHCQLTIGKCLDEVKAAINQDAQLKWVSEAFLRENEVACWSQLPLWVYKEIQGFLKVNSNKAIAHGLNFRSITETIRDTQLWSKEIYRAQFLNKVLPRRREQELLAKYRDL